MMSVVNQTSPERKRTWSQNPEGRRARILQEASREFSEKGYRKSRLDNIARLAGVSEGLVYSQFGTKRGLLEALGEEYGRGFAEAAFGAAQDYEPSHVATIVDNIFAYVNETEGSLAAFLLMNEPAEDGVAQDANRAQMVEAIQRNLDRWTAEGKIPKLNTQITAEIQFALVEGALRDCFLRKAGADEKAYRHEVTRILRASLMSV